MSPHWEVILSQQAERDFRGILKWTAEQFGNDQVEVYRETLISALAALEAGPDVWGAKQRTVSGPQGPLLGGSQDSSR